MNRNVFCLLLLFAFVSDAPIVKAQNQEGEWELVFSDEFDGKNGSQPDPAKWVRSQRGSSMWSRWISGSDKVVYIKNGKLVCRAIPNKTEPADTAKMLTGAIETLGKFAFQYGKVEVRMKTNLKQGNFPAAWLRPAPGSKDDRYGEIDVVEMFGNQGKATHTVHTHRSYTLKKEGITRDFKENVSVKQWHVYGLEWTKDQLVWTVDGRQVGVYRRDHSPQMDGEGQWTFDRPFYLRLNQSVGSGSHPLLIPNVKTTYETQFDWIRVYQRKK